MRKNKERTRLLHEPVQSNLHGKPLGLLGKGHHLIEDLPVALHGEVALHQRPSLALNTGFLRVLSKGNRNTPFRKQSVNNMQGTLHSPCR